MSERSERTVDTAFRHGVAIGHRTTRRVLL